MKRIISETESKQLAKILGIVFQGLVLGILLSFAIFELWAQADGVRLFRYQEF